MEKEKSGKKAEAIQRKAACFRMGAISEEEKYLVPEERYDLYLNGEMIHTFFCSPWYLEDLAYGFLYLEGYISKAEAVKEVCIKRQEHRIEVQAGQINNVCRRDEKAAEKDIGKEENTAKNVADSAIDNTTDKKIPEKFRISPKEIIALAAELDERSHRFRLTGGVHSAALAGDGKILLLREDVGRHNAAEKLLGACIREQIDTTDKRVVFSGRVAAEILEKAAVIGAPTLIAVSAPTSRAVEMAEEKGILLIGFARGETFNVYTFPERLERATMNINN